MTGDAAWPEDALEVGRIGEAWGVKGWFRVLPYSASADALRGSRRWLLQPAEGRPGMADARALRVPPALDVTDLRPHGDGLVGSASGIADRGAAEALRGARIFIARSDFPPAGRDEFYWADLIGLAVVSRSGDALGRVAGLIDTGPQSVLRVAPEGEGEAEERLIPFVSAYVDTVDFEGRRIVVDWALDY